MDISNREPEDRNGRCTHRRRRRLLIGLSGLIGIALLLSFFPTGVRAQKEVTSDVYRYQDRERKSIYYEKHEVRPRTHLPFVEAGIPRTDLITLAPTAESVRFRKYTSDAHLGLRFYGTRTCIRCHPRQQRNLHRVRAKITCRQCHGDEPISGILHYYSSMHPRRRYAFICAKCHKGSSASFATYRIHEPSPIYWDTRKTFPVLFYAFWMMVVIAVGTFAAFLPHAFMWGLREFFPKRDPGRIKGLLTGRSKADDKN